MATQEEILEMLSRDYEPGDLVNVTALEHCSGLTAPGPDRETIVLAEGASGEVPWFVARPWIARKRAVLVDAPEPVIADPEVGDLVQWISGEQEMWTKRKRIKRIEDGFAFFDGLETGIPLAELER